MKFEQYIPTRKEVRVAEESMTPEQQALSYERLAKIGESYGAHISENFEPLYVGAFITEEEKARLKELFPPEYIKEFLHHMTFAILPSPDEAYALPVGEEIELQVIGIAQDEHGQALVLESPLPTRGIPHITISTTSYKDAVYSNELIKNKGFVQLDQPISIHARVGYGDKKNKISFDVSQEVLTKEERLKKEREDLESRFLGALKTGERIYDRNNSHLHDGDTIRKNFSIIFSQIDGTSDKFLEKCTDMGQIIGASACVETTEADEVVYAQRIGRAGLTRFVKGREPKPTSSITTVFMRIPDGYILLTAYAGEKSEMEPWDPRATTASVEFWKKHALVWDETSIIPNTEIPEAKQ